MNDYYWIAINALDLLAKKHDASVANNVLIELQKGLDRSVVHGEETSEIERLIALIKAYI